MPLDRDAYVRALRVWAVTIVVLIGAVLLLSMLSGCADKSDGPSDASKSADVREHDRLGRHTPTPIEIPRVVEPSDQDT
jgi:hypothetical protein